MGTARMHERENELNTILFDGLQAVPGLHLLAEKVADRLSIFSFYLESVHYNLMVRLLNDRFGVQSRGGCSCAGTYGHYLLHVDPSRSHRITDMIDHGDLSEKPGWVRLSVHPTTTTDEAQFIVDAVRDCAIHGSVWADDYVYSTATNEFRHRHFRDDEGHAVRQWFTGPWIGEVENGGISKTDRCFVPALGL